MLCSKHSTSLLFRLWIYGLTSFHSTLSTTPTMLERDLGPLLAPTTTMKGNTDFYPSNLGLSGRSGHPDSMRTAYEKWAVVWITPKLA